MVETKCAVWILGSLAAIAGNGCVMVPVAADGTPLYPGPVSAAYPAIPVPTLQGPGPNYMRPVPARSAATPATSTATVPIVNTASAGGGAPTVIQARLYPANDVATQTGLLAGTVTNMMTGTGVFQLDYRGERLTGEATRVQNDERRGVAHAYGDRGTYMSCEYRMTTPYQGTGTCTMSTGAQYQVHMGG